MTLFSADKKMMSMRRIKKHDNTAGLINDDDVPDNNEAFVFPPERERLIKIYRHYGFKECGDIYNFLEYVSALIPDRAELKFIAERTRECLSRYDDGSHYFDELRTILLILNEQLKKTGDAPVS